MPSHTRNWVVLALLAAVMSPALATLSPPQHTRIGASPLRTSARGLPAGAMKQTKRACVVVAAHDLVVGHSPRGSGAVVTLGSDGGHWVQRPAASVPVWVVFDLQTPTHVSALRIQYSAPHSHCPEGLQVATGPSLEGPWTPAVLLRGGCLRRSAAVKSAAGAASGRPFDAVPGDVLEVPVPPGYWGRFWRLEVAGAAGGGFEGEFRVSDLHVEHCPGDQPEEAVDPLGLPADATQKHVPDAPRRRASGVGQCGIGQYYECPPGGACGCAQCTACGQDQAIAAECSDSTDSVCAVAAPLVLPRRGVAPLTVTATTVTSGNPTVVVTTDGTVPTCDATSAGGGAALELEASATVQAVACHAGLATSSVTTVAVDVASSKMVVLQASVTLQGVPLVAFRAAETSAVEGAAATILGIDASRAFVTEVSVSSGGSGLTVRLSVVLSGAGATPVLGKDQVAGGLIAAATDGSLVSTLQSRGVAATAVVVGEDPQTRELVPAVTTSRTRHKYRGLLEMPVVLAAGMVMFAMARCYGTVSQQRGQDFEESKRWPHGVAY